MKRFAVVFILMSFLLAGCAGTKTGGDDGVQVKARGSVETSHGVVVRR